MGSFQAPLLPPSPTAVEIDRMALSIQAVRDGPRGLGKFIDIPLDPTLLRTDTGVVWAFGSSNGSRVSYSLLGDDPTGMMLMDFNIGLGFVGIYSTIAAGCAFLKLKMPDGFTSLSTVEGSRIPYTSALHLVDVGAGFDGFAYAQASLNYINISRPGAGLTGPNIGVAGQILFPYARV